MILNQEKYELGVAIAKTRTEGRSTEDKMTKAETDLRDQVEQAGGWDADVQSGFDDTLREELQTREPVAAPVEEDGE